MGRVIAVANQKGGVGKSTTAINLSACLAEKGKKVLAIDIDPQGNTTSGLGVDKNNVENTLYELLLGEAEAKDTTLHEIPCSILIGSHALHSCSDFLFYRSYPFLSDTGLPAVFRVTRNDARGTE